MLRTRQLHRLLRITQIFVRHDLDEFVTAIHLFRPYRWLLRLAPWRWMPRARPARGARLRQALEELGPVFVKFGQALSTRPDLLPDDIAEELARLQDRVPPFAEAQAVATIEHSLGARIDDIFSAFERTPVASASVAQVHIARLHDGAEVAVKVLRPGIKDVIERDVDLLYVLARLAVRYLPDGKRLRPVEIVDQFRKTLADELDLRREAANANQLRANFADSDLLYVPKIFWEYTRRDVMVLERIHGIPISNISALKDARVDMRRLAHNGVTIFFTQAFRDGFFHADMHPGNIFVSPEGQYRAVDFGIMGSLGEEDKRYLAENFLAFFNRDYRTVAEAHLRAGWVPRDTSIVDFESAVRAVCEPIFARPLSEISFGRLLLQLFQIARQFNMEVQPQLVLLQKTLFNIEGLGRRLYPELDLWETAKPFLEQWVREHMGPRALLRELRRELPKWWLLAPQLPRLLHATLKRAAEGDLSLEARSRDLMQLRLQLKENHRRTYLAIAGSALLIAGAVVVGAVDLSELPAIWGWTLGIGGAFLLWYTRPAPPADGQ